MIKRKFFWIDSSYDDKSKNKETYESLKSKSEFLDLKLFKELGPAFEEIKKLDNEVIFVLIQGSLYQDYYFKLKELKSTLNCLPVSIIYTIGLRKVFLKQDLDKNGKIKEETINSIGHEYYNKGGVATSVKEIFQFIENYLGYKLEKNSDEKEKKPDEKLFHFELIDDDYGNLIFSCLYSKVQSRNTQVSNSEINEFNEMLIEKHQCKFGENSKDFLKIKKIPIGLATRIWIKNFTNENTFHNEMHKQFRENNFINYKTFYKALYRGIQKNYLKSKFNVPLYFFDLVEKNDIESLQKNLNNSQKKLIYSKQFLSFSEDMNVSFKFFINKDDLNLIPILLEINISNSLETYSNNVDIGDLSAFNLEKEVTFFPFTFFVIEDKITDFKYKGINFKKIKLNYLGNYSKQIKDNINKFDEEKKKIKSLLNSNSNILKNIKIKFKNEFPDLDLIILSNWLQIELKLMKENLKHKDNYVYPKNKIEIKMGKKGKFLGDNFYRNYHWMLKIYFDNELQTEEETNEIVTGSIPKIITIEIIYPLFDCKKMFYLCENITEINFVEFDTSKVTNMRSMFSDCTHLKKVNFDNFDTYNVTNMSCMFYNCFSLKTLNLSKFKTDNVENMSAMFYMCLSLINLDFDLKKKNTNKLNDISFMFRCCYSLIDYNIFGINIEGIKIKDGYI